MASIHERRTGPITNAIGGMGVLALSSFVLYHGYLAVMHRDADPAIGRMIRANNHGQRFYITLVEGRILYGLLGTAVLLILTAVLLRFLSPKRKTRPTFSL